MKNSIDQRERLAKMTFSTVYPHYVNKVERKGRTRQELHQVIEWLTGFDEKNLSEFIEQPITFQEFFSKATINPNAKYITGVICGHRVEEINDELTRYIRYLDKLVDELAKGKKLENILRPGQ